MLDYYKYRYLLYRLLTLLDRHNKKDILFVSLKIEDKGVQSREFLDNDKIVSTTQKVKIYDYHLTRQVFVGFIRDLVERVELIIYLKPVEFIGKIVIQE